jgi:hypothetical protein
VVAKTTIPTLANQVPDENELFLVSATEEPAPSLLLMRPFIRLKPSPPDAPNACYFYSKLQEDGTVKFISHHFEREPAVAETDPDVRAFIDELQGPAGQ